MHVHLRVARAAPRSSPSHLHACITTITMYPYQGVVAFACCVTSSWACPHASPPDTAASTTARNPARSFLRRAYTSDFACLTVNPALLEPVSPLPVAAQPTRRTYAISPSRPLQTPSTMSAFVPLCAVLPGRQAARPSQAARLPCAPCCTNRQPRSRTSAPRRHARPAAKYDYVKLCPSAQPPGPGLI